MKIIATVMLPRGSILLADFVFGYFVELRGQAVMSASFCFSLVKITLRWAVGYAVIFSSGLLKQFSRMNREFIATANNEQSQ
jgi:hypothetical protein